MGTVINIGIDVHKDSYSLCSYSFATKQAFGQTKIEATAIWSVEPSLCLQQPHIGGNDVDGPSRLPVSEIFFLVCGDNPRLLQPKFLHPNKKR